MLRKTYIIILLFWVCSGNLHAQLNMNVEKLRASFVESTKTDFDLIRDTILPDRYGVNYWLVTLKPKRTGLFTINYYFESKPKFGNRKFEDKFQINVTAKGDKRNIFYKTHFSKNDICLGDEIVIPIRLVENVQNHTFLAKRDAMIPLNDNVTFPKETLNWVIENTSGEALLFLDVSSIRTVYRNPSYSRMEYYAFFEAKKPGRFNLKIGDVICPVTIMAENESIKKLISHYSTYWQEDNGSSASGGEYPVENNILRVGDRISIIFLSYVEHEKNPKVIEKKLKISKMDHQLLGKEYDNWLK